MKAKILVIILIIVTIVLGVLLGMKYIMNKEEKEENIGKNEYNSLITVNLEDKKEEKPKTKYSGDKRTIAVMIDNVGDAIPQTGLNEAMIVYEATVEGGLTRFMAVYKDPQIETIGPVRSARPYFLDYALENDSIYVHFGGSQKALSEIGSLRINNMNGIEVSEKIFWRTNKKAAPHNAMINVEDIWNYASSKKYKTTTETRNVLNYVTDEVNLKSGMEALTVSIPYSTSKVKFVYNEEKKIYERYVGSTLQKDWITNEPLTAKNIIITFAHNYTTDEEGRTGRQAIENIGALNGYYITNGKAEKIKCNKSSRSDRTVYSDLTGKEINVNDGNTYIEIVPLNLNISF